MIHKMHLDRGPFAQVESGRKSIEIRVLDQKRKRVKVGDTIVFERRPDGKEVECTVIGLSVFKSFKDLLNAFDKSKFGHPKYSTLKEQLKKQYLIYDRREEREKGVVGIHIRLI